MESMLDVNKNPNLPKMEVPGLQVLPHLDGQLRAQRTGIQQHLMETGLNNITAAWTVPLLRPPSILSGLVFCLLWCCLLSFPLNNRIHMVSPSDGLLLRHKVV